MKKIKALHIASFNGNIGDNANHNGFRQKLKDALGCEINYKEIEIREFYQSWNIKDFNSNEFIQACNENELVIFGGGNFFELKWDYSSTGTTINISHESLDKIKTPIFFHALGCDIAKGVSESNIKKFEKFLDKVTGSDKYLITVRNDGSYETIHKLYGSKYDEKVYKVPDGAFFLETKSYEYPELNKTLKSIGINIVSDMKDIRFGSQIQDGIEYDDFITKFGEVINNFFLKHEDYQIIFFPHIYSDLMAISELLEKIKDIYRRTRVVVAPCLTGEGSEEYIFGLYNECEFILGMRFHSNVCSIAQGIPTIGLSSYKKIHDLYSELGLLDRVIYVNRKNFQENLINQIEFTMANIDNIRHRYKKVKQDINNEGGKFYKEMKLWAVKNRII